MSRLGLMFLKQFADYADSHAETFDFLCVPPEEYRGASATGDLGFLALLAARFPVQLHSTSLSVGSAEGPNESWLSELLKIVQSAKIEAVSDHLGYSRAASLWTGTPLINCEFSEKMACHIARSCRQVTDTLGVPFLLENNSYCIEWPESHLHEGEFWHMATESGDFQMLLDLPNLIGRCHVSQEDPYEIVHEMPLQRVGQIHMAGGDWLDEYETGSIARAHSKNVTDDAWALLGHVLQYAPQADVVLERTRDFESESVMEELSRIRELLN